MPIDFASKFRTIGGWVERPTDLQPELVGNVTADVVVVGAGFAGLSTALELASRGADVVILERDFAGFGASGRNAGYLAPGHGLEFDLFVKRVGHARASSIVRYYDEGVRYVEARIRQHGIECDYNASGLIRAAVHPSQEENVRKSMRTAIDLGSPAGFLDSAAMRARGIPPAFLCGSFFAGGTLDPGKYVMGLRRAALAAGIRIFEGTAVESFAHGAVVRAKTAKGTASAPFLVLATNAYTPQLGFLRDQVAPMRVSAVETAPLTPAQLAALGWPHREGIVTAHLSMESYRLTARDTLLFTTKRLGYEYGGRTPNVPDERAYRALVETMGDRFPQLRGITIRSCWSGYVTMAYDALPVVGEAGEGRNVLYAAGCSGHGIGTQSLVGRLLAARIKGESDPFLAALDHRTPRTLPEPLQWCLLRSVLGLANLLDARVDHKARRLNGDAQ
jgi:gamma-glutamylputrescine oxidase